MIITLASGHHVQIDAEDYALVSRHTWHAFRRGRRIYARTNLPDGPRHPDGRRNRRAIFMHNLIMPPPPGLETDHKNNDGLDNQRHNLRPATRSQNNGNARKRANASTPYKGVSTAPCIRHPWRATIRANGHQHHLGYFRTPEHAARAYDEAARELFGEYARPNFPKEA